MGSQSCFHCCELESWSRDGYRSQCPTWFRRRFRCRSGRTGLLGDGLARGAATTKHGETCEPPPGLRRLGLRGSLQAADLARRGVCWRQKAVVESQQGELSRARHTGCPYRSIWQWWQPIPASLSFRATLRTEGTRHCCEDVETVVRHEHPPLRVDFRRRYGVTS